MFTYYRKQVAIVGIQNKQENIKNSSQNNAYMQLIGYYIQAIYSRSEQIKKWKPSFVFKIQKSRYNMKQLSIIRFTDDIATLTENGSIQNMALQMYLIVYMKRELYEYHQKKKGTG